MILDVLRLSISVDLHMAETQLRSRRQEAVLKYLVEMRGAEDSGTVIAQTQEVFENTTG